MTVAQGDPHKYPENPLPKRLARRLLLPNLWAKTLYVIAVTIGQLSRVGVRASSSTALREGVLAIEAGEVAWEHLFFKEVLQSAKEFVGEQQVKKLAVTADRSYVRQVSEFVNQNAVTHYFYDPRTGSQNLISGLTESFRLLTLFARRGIIPIVYCTDISLRRWRFQAAIVSAINGICVCLTREDIARKMFPHERLIGPALMPLSIKTLEHLREMRARRKVNAPLKVSFFGSLYEPRASQLEEIQVGLSSEGIHFDIRGRVPGGQRISDDDYWEEIISSDILVSTSSQIQSPGMDLGEINHLIYRFTEALACGVCLVIENAPGVERFFADSEDLILWNNTAQAVEAVVHLSQSKVSIARIGTSGHARLEELIRNQMFWIDIEDAI